MLRSTFRGRPRSPARRLHVLVSTAALLAVPLIASSAAAAGAASPAHHQRHQALRRTYDMTPRRHPRASAAAYGTCVRGQNCLWSIDEQQYVLNVPDCHIDKPLIVYTPQSQPSGCGSANEIWYSVPEGMSGSSHVYVLYSIIGRRDVCANVKGNVYRYGTPIISWPCNPHRPSANEKFVWGINQRFLPIADQNFAWNTASGIFVGAEVVLWSKCDCTNEFWYTGSGVPFPSRFGGP